MANEIICLGDSITGWKNYSLDEKEWPLPVYPKYLEELLAKDSIRNPVINAGFNGEKSDRAYDIIGEYNLRYAQSQFFIIEFGTNDFEDEEYSARVSKNIRASLSAAIKRVKSLGKTAVLINQHYTTKDEKEKEVIDLHNRALTFDYIHQKVPVINVCSKLKPEHLEDGAHPNEIGARIIAEEVYRALKPMLIFANQ